MTVDVLVTGSAGFVGQALCKRLLDEGRTVQGVDLRAGEVPTLRMDVTDGGQVLEVLRRVKPRVVVHAAAVVDDRGPADQFQRVNVGGTQNLVDAACAIGVERFVQVSSIAALGYDPGPDAGEDTPLVFDTGSPYFDTKAASEKLVRDAAEEDKLPAVIVRPGDVWGPGSQPWVERPLELIAGPVPMLVDGGQGLICHCWIGNLVDGLVAAIDHPDAVGGIFQFHDGSQSTTLRDYLDRLADAAGLRRPRMSVPKPVALAMAAGFEGLQRVSSRLKPPMSRGAVHYLCRRATYSIDASRRVLGWEPRVSLDEGMALLAQTLNRQARDDR